MEVHHHQTDYINHLSTEEELGIEEIDWTPTKLISPAGPAEPAGIPLTGVSVSPLDGVTAVEVTTKHEGAGTNGKKITNRFQRESLQRTGRATEAPGREIKIRGH